MRSSLPSRAENFARLRQIDARRIRPPDLEDQRLLDGEPAIAAEGLALAHLDRLPPPSAVLAGSCHHSTSFSAAT